MKFILARGHAQIKPSLSYKGVIAGPSYNCSPACQSLVSRQFWRNNLEQINEMACKLMQSAIEMMAYCCRCFPYIVFYYEYKGLWL